MLFRQSKSDSVITGVWLYIGFLNPIVDGFLTALDTQIPK